MEAMKANIRVVTRSIQLKEMLIGVEDGVLQASRRKKKKLWKNNQSSCSDIRFKNILIQTAF